MNWISDAPTGRHRLLVYATPLLIFALPLTAGAAPSCSAPSLRETRQWPAPLDRLVTLHGRDVALRDALDRLAAAARLRLSYSTEVLALDRRVCMSYDSVAAGNVLADLLDGSAVTPVLAGDDQVVLTPSAPPPKAEQRGEQNVKVLDRVLVTGNVFGGVPEGLARAITVIERDQLARQKGGALSQTLNGAVPGVWLWDQSPSSLFAQYGSFRGASSFHISYPKVYIDGIEVANPLLVTELSPDAVERIEVIRGPQGAAMYGSDAIAGVVNIVMRHDNSEGGEIAQLRTTAGLTHSAYAAHPVLVQEHTLGLHGGGELKSSALSLTLGSVGSYLPGAQSREARADGGFRIIGARSVFTGTARLFAKDAGVSTSPLIAGPAVPQLAQSSSMDHDSWQTEHDLGPPTMTGAATATSQSVREYTLGTTAIFDAKERQTYAVTIGVDGYRLSGEPRTSATPIPSAIDLALRAARGGADRATIRASSVNQFGSVAGAAGTATLAAEYSLLQQQAANDGMLTLGPRVGDYSAWQSNAGIVGQLDVSWRGTLFLSSGLRLERTDGLAATGGLESLPMLGAALVRSAGPLTTKLRASYGRGIRPAGSAVPASWLAPRSVVQHPLSPEEQSGVELGADAYLGRTFALHLTRFDQYAYNLIQRVAVASTLMPLPIDDNARRLMYALQNLGGISNRGWELAGSLSAGQLSVTGTLSLVDSRVRQVAPGYSGDLQPGDRMLAVPAFSGGLTTTWTSRRWSTSITATRASSWTNYDGLALVAASAVVAHPIVGEQLRNYWRSYPGVTRIDASASRQLFRAFTVVLAGRNLLDAQRGEPDNLTIIPGRTLTAGLEAKF